MRFAYRRLRERLSLLTRFGLVSFVLVAVLGTGLAQRVAGATERDAVLDARTVATLTARLRLQPLLTPEDLRAVLGQERREDLRGALASGLEGVQVARIKLWNRDGRVVYSDDEEIVGRSFPVEGELAEALEGEVAAEVTHLDAAEEAGERSFGKLVEVYVPIRFGDGEPAGAFELYVPYGAVAQRIERERATTLALLAAGMLILWAVLFRLVAGASRTLRRHAEESDRQAHHDALTGLPNRLGFTRALDAAVAGGRPAAILLLDLDRFREVNDTLGHAIGDALLREAGGRIGRRAGPEALVARLGGDEFAVLTTSAGAEGLACGIATELARPVQLGAIPLRMEVSIGLVRAPEHGDGSAELLQRADVAMYRAKHSRLGFCQYTADTDPYDPDRLALVGELQQGIGAGELVLHFQPKIDLRTRAVVGAEALVRWQHPQRGLLYPDSFIELAEHTNLIRPLTLWVLESALGECRRWRDAGAELTVAVNLSAANLLDEELPNDVALLLARFGLPPAALELEITESLMMIDPVRAGRVLGMLHSMRVGLSVDDYGTGHSSLTYLRRLPVSELKIDRSFVTRMLESHDDATIVRSTVDLAHSLGLRVVAEGVETAVVERALAEMGCDVAQGYHIARPMPAADLGRWIAHHGGSPGWRAGPDHGERPQAPSGRSLTVR